MRCGNKRKRTVLQLVTVKNKLTSVSNASVLLLTMNFVLTFSKVNADSLGYRALCIYSYCDNVIMKFLINNQTDA